jgi:hypothetical protein
MTASVADIPSARERVKPTREQALAIAERHKAIRRSRTRRIRRAIAVLAVGAFIGPFGVIFTRVAAGHDPALSTNKAVAGVASTSTSNASRDASASRAAAATQAAAASASTESSSSGPSGNTTQTTASTPAPVTTQQS